MQVFEMEKAKIGMCVNPEMRNCEKQLLPEGLGEHKERERKGVRENFPGPGNIC